METMRPLTPPDVTPPDGRLPLGRRPLRSRTRSWALALAGGLARLGVSPEHISLAGLAFALAAAGALLLAKRWEGALRALALVFAAAAVQLRLLANLLDGLVAVEGGRGRATGELWNDVPDRIADVGILASAGYAAGSGWGPLAGWLAAVLAVMTAQVRALGAALGQPGLFEGPMGKPQRMVVVTVGCLVAAGEAVASMLEPGDVIVANKGTSRILAVGKVVEPGYEWRPERPEYRHIVRVDWDTSYEKSIEPQKRWALVTVASVPNTLYRRIAEPPPGHPLTPPVTVDPKLTEIAAALQRKKQVIVYGPPGTGKAVGVRGWGDSVTPPGLQRGEGMPLEGTRC